MTVNSADCKQKTACARCRENDRQRASSDAKVHEREGVCNGVVRRAGHSTVSNVDQQPNACGIAARMEQVLWPGKNSSSQQQQLCGSIASRVRFDDQNLLLICKTARTDRFLLDCRPVLSYRPYVAHCSQASTRPGFCRCWLVRITSLTAPS